MTLYAKAGDRLVVKGRRIGKPDRDAEVLEVKGTDGGPPFVVRWSDSGRVTTFFPGVDAEVDHFVHDNDTSQRVRASRESAARHDAD